MPRESAVRLFLLLFIATPLIELWLLIKVGGVIGAPSTIGLVLLTAVVGVALIRHQGLSTLMRGQQRLDAGELPAGEMAEGMMLACAGILLLTPGFCTDALGFALLIPPLRRRLAVRFTRGMTIVGQGWHFRRHGEDVHTMEGEFWRESDDRGTRPGDRRLK